MKLQSSMRRAIAVVAALLMAITMGSAQAATFGRTTVGTTPSGGLRSDFKRGSKFTLTQTGTLKRLCAYLDGNGVRTSESQQQYFRLVLYRDAGGVPGTRVAEALPEQAILEGLSARWICQATALVPLTAGSYWIIIHTGGSPPGTSGGSTIIRYFYDGAPNWYGNADDFSDGASYAFGAGGAGDGTLSAYADFATPSELGSAGKTTIGATPSGGLRTDFKRGSSFTVSEPARVASISVYLDGLGAPSGFENVRALIYKDKAGVPDALVGGDWIGEIRGGASPRWLTWHAREQISLGAGKYWLILHTSGDPVARYYFDGTKNWYGNADEYYSGPSNPFGAGGPGDGTLTAFVSYLRGPFVTQHFGRTSVGTRPERLTANFLRGGFFHAPGEYKWLTAMYAYVDGLGGASGTQKMKMLLNDGYDAEQAVTQEVTIPAGMTPRWVRFPLTTPIRLQDPSFLGNDGYYVFLYTGNTSGVGRAYGGGVNNWHGTSWDYPNVYPLFYSPLEPGSGTLSLYGELSVPGP